MKIRVRNLPNGKWICEVRRWYWLSWRAAAFREYDTGLSIKRDKICKAFNPEIAGSAHYPTCWHDTADQAEKVRQEVVSFFNLESKP